jgi:hypothetical protein
MLPADEHQVPPEPVPGDDPMPDKNPSPDDEPVPDHHPVLKPAADPAADQRA